jgi:hypothetical protein
VSAAGDLESPSPPAALKPLVTVLVNSSLEQTYVGCIAGVSSFASRPLRCMDVREKYSSVQYSNEGDQRLCQCRTSGAEFRDSQHDRLIGIAMYEG